MYAEDINEFSVLMDVILNLCGNWTSSLNTEKLIDELEKKGIENVEELIVVSIDAGELIEIEEEIRLPTNSERLQQAKEENKMKEKEEKPSAVKFKQIHRRLDGLLCNVENRTNAAANRIAERCCEGSIDEIKLAAEVYRHLDAIRNDILISREGIIRDIKDLVFIVEHE